MVYPHSGHPLAESQAQDRVSSPAKDRRSANSDTQPVLTTNRKSYMGFRLVPKSVTVNDLERRNGRVLCVISPNSVAFVAN